MVSRADTLFDVVTRLAGRAPAFWGRYIGREGGGNLDRGEATFLHNHTCKILIVYAGTTALTVGTRRDGSDHAARAIGIAHGLDVPGGVWIYANTERAWSPTADFFAGWAEAMRASPYGGAGGVYGDTGTAPEQAAHFNTPYCLAYTGDSRMQGASYVWTNQPSTPCDLLAAHAPAFGPLIPPCHPPTVIYQYSVECAFGGVAVDVDLANAAGFASMWERAAGV